MYFFCVGSQKTGGTLLARVLDQHPDIACLWESYAFKPTSRASIFNPHSDKWRIHGFSESDIRRWSRIWNAQPYAFFRRTLSQSIGYTSFTTSCFRQTMLPALADFARRCGVTVVGDKWPGYIRYLENLLSGFPDARIIYNVRDPRAVWNSAQRFKNRQRGDELLIRMLENDDRIRPYLAHSNFVTVRYEDLVCYPEATIQQIYDFLGLNISNPHLLYDSKKDFYPDRWSWVPEVYDQINSLHAYKWKNQTSISDINRITELSYSFIKYHNYSP